MKVYNKLVRDNIPAIIANQGKKAKYRVIQGAELEKALKDKLLEEVNELLKAENEAQFTEEMVDILQVLLALYSDMHGISTRAIRQVLIDKTIAKGAFTKGYFLESVED